MKKGILFDLDGTLWDSAEGVAASWNEVLEEKGRPERCTVESIHSVMGKTMDAIGRILFPRDTEEEAGRLTLEATITAIEDKGSHTEPSGSSYVANVTNPANGAVYTEKKQLDPVASNGHQWKYNKDADGNYVVTFNEAYTEAAISRTCQNTDGLHDTTKDGDLVVTVTSTDIKVEKSDAKNCQETGSATYSVTFKDETGAVLKDIDGTELVITKVVTGVAGPHDYEASWSFDSETKTYKLTLTCKICGEKVETTVTPEVKETSAGTVYTGKYEYNGKEFKNVVTVKKNGEVKPGDLSISDSTVFNTFFTTIDEGVDLSTGDVVLTGSNLNTKKSAVYYDAEATTGGFSVKLKSGADRKKAGSAANGTFIFATEDGGEVEYSLPVSYVVPKLKTTVSSVTVNSKKDAQTVSTVVTVQDVSGAYVPVDTSALTSAKLGTLSLGNGIEVGTNAGELLFTTNAKSTGKLAIQLDNWSIPVEVSFSIKAVTNDVIAVENAVKNQIVFNVNDVDGKSIEVPVTLNGQAADSENVVAVAVPSKDSGLVVTGIDESGNVDGTLTFTKEEGKALTAGTYSYKLPTASKGSLTLKVKVSKVLLTKAVSLKQQGKMDIVTKQPLVLVPTFKDVQGEVGTVTVNNDAFTAEYDADKNLITVVPADEDYSKISAQNYEITLTIPVGETECTSVVKFKANATKPTVKIDKVTIPASGEATGTAYVQSTYKLNGKTYTVAPKEEGGIVPDAKKVTANDDGTYTDSTTGATIVINSDNTITISGVKKAGSIKFDVYFDGLAKPVTKALSVKIKK